MAAFLWSVLLRAGLMEFLLANLEHFAKVKHSTILPGFPKVKLSVMSTQREKPLLKFGPITHRYDTMHAGS